MKNLLNNISQEEKNRILEMHSGGMKVMTENFNKLLSSKLGDAKPYITESESDGEKQAVNILTNILNPSEIDFLTDELSTLGKEGLKDEVNSAMDGNTELSEDGEMSDKEYKIRHIINKIIKRGGGLAALGIVPAAMFVSGGAALGLGVAAIASLLLKDSAFWSKDGIHRDELKKSDKGIGSLVPSDDSPMSKDGSGNY
jgi:hypothetical protein